MAQYNAGQAHYVYPVVTMPATWDFVAMAGTKSVRSILSILCK